VFVGTVTDISPAFGDFEASSKTQNRSVRFSLDQAHRGVEGNEVEISNWITSCEYEFEKGKKYFVYAYRSTTDNSLGTHGCSRTTEISHATEDLSYVRGLSEAKAEQTISGIVLENRYTPVVGSRVIIRGNRKRYSLVTDDKGRFSVVVARPGKYSVRFVLPRNSAVIGTEDQLKQFTGYQTTDKSTIMDAEVNIQSGRCAFFDVPLFIDKESP